MTVYNCDIISDVRSSQSSQVVSGDGGSDTDQTRRKHYDLNSEDHFR